MSKPTLFDVKTKLATVGAELQRVENELIDTLGNPSASGEDIRKLKDTKADLQERFDGLKEAHDRMEREQADDLRKKNPMTGASNEKEAMVKAKAAYYRAAILGKSVPMEVLNTLKAIPAPTDAGGENFLPTTLSNELISEPFTKNPLRGAISVTNIRGLELPKIAYTIDDDNFVGDSDTAKELELDGDKVTFGRFKSKVKVKISDTVLYGSDVDLVNYVENALQSGLAAKEKKVTFASASTQVVGEEHMSFYQEDTGLPVITEVAGETLFKAIKGAIAALHEDFRENATIIMRYADYLDILESLSNGNTSFFDLPPEKILGKPAIFADAAVTPIVGDLNYLHLNYDIAPTYDTDKDVNTGDYIWVLTAWLDQKRKLNSAFRLAVVEPALS